MDRYFCRLFLLTGFVRVSSMSFYTKMLLIKVVTMIVLAPLGGWALLLFAEYGEKIWKTNSRVKKWLLLSYLFIFLLMIGGFLQ